MSDLSSAPEATLYDLTSVSSLDVLADLCTSEQSFRVEFEGESRTLELTVDRGVIRATSEVGAQRIGDMVVSAGLATQDEVEQQAARRNPDQPLGLALVEAGVVSPLQMHDLLSAQATSILEQAIVLRRGVARVVPGNSTGPALLRLPLRRCLYQAAKRALADDPFGRLGGPDLRLRPVYRTADLLELELEDEEFKLLSLVDGQTRFEELVHSGLYSVERNVRILAAAFRLGLLAVAEAPTVRLRKNERPSSPTRTGIGPSLRLVRESGRRSRAFSPNQSNHRTPGGAPAAESDFETAEVAAATGSSAGLFEQAMSAYLERDYEKALQLFESYSADMPHDRRPLHNIEQLRMKLGKDRVDP